MDQHDRHTRASCRYLLDKDLNATARLLQRRAGRPLVGGTAMIFGHLRRLARRRATSKFSRSLLGQTLQQHTKEYFFNGKTILSGFSPDQKQHIIESFTAGVVKIVGAPNPFHRLRKEMVATAIAYANLQVLCLLPEERSGVYFSRSPYISGELVHHIHRCAQHHTELKDPHHDRVALRAMHCRNKAH
jgi:hypothetical protein